MEQECKHCCHNHNVPTLYDIQIHVVAGLKWDHNAVQDIGREEEGKELLQLEDELARRIAREIPLWLWHRCTLQKKKSTARMAKITVQLMKVQRESPPTDRDLRILMMISANPNVCTVPDKVKIKENSPLLKQKYMMTMMEASTIQYIASSFLNTFIS